MTAKALVADDVPFRVVVEPQERDAYGEALGYDKILSLPFANQGMGSTPARNWIREHAAREGYARHWCLDDNIFCFYRIWEGRRVPVHAGVALRVCEDFTDRFQRIAVSGPAYDMFVIPYGSAGIRSPFFKNVHVYSAMLINNAAPFTWRLRYNEDTDICLQALVSGWNTLLVNAFTAKKRTTMTMGGGNASIYETGVGGSDTMGRYEMAEMLRRQWPGIVKVTRRYGRYQHSIDWARFGGNTLDLREGSGLAALPEVDEYGLRLRKVRPVRSAEVEGLYREYDATLATLTASDELWRGLPGFRPIAKPPKLVVRFRTNEAREGLASELGVTVDKRFKDKAWSAWWPDRGRHDPASLRFEP